MKRLHQASAEWYDYLERFDPVEEIDWLDADITTIDEIGCRTGRIGAYCLSKGMGWHGWEPDPSFMERAIMRAGFDVSAERFPKAGAAQFLLALFAPLAKVSPPELEDYAQNVYRALKEGGKALIELWWQEGDFDPKPHMDVFNGACKLVRTRQARIINRSSVSITRHWLHASSEQRPQRDHAEDVFYRHNHQTVLDRFAWGKPEIIQHRGNSYLRLCKS